MKTLKTDSFGILSEKNSMSKYWGVSTAKNGQGFTVRFQDSVSKETINFKPKSLLSEQVAAVIARGFYEDRNLYSNSIELLVDTDEGVYIVNCCSNTIKLKEEGQTTIPHIQQFVDLIEDMKGKKGEEIACIVVKEDVGKAVVVPREKPAERPSFLRNLDEVAKKCEEALMSETKPVRDISAELREIRRQTRLIGKRIERLAKALKEAA